MDGRRYCSGLFFNSAKETEYCWKSKRTSSTSRASQTTHFWEPIPYEKLRNVAFLLSHGTKIWYVRSPSQYICRTHVILEGDIMHLKVLAQDIIVVSSIEAASDLLDKRATIYSDRYHSTMVNELYATVSVYTTHSRCDSTSQNRHGLVVRLIKLRPDMAQGKKAVSLSLQHSLHSTIWPATFRRYAAVPPTPSHIGTILGPFTLVRSVLLLVKRGLRVPSYYV